MNFFNDYICIYIQVNGLLAYETVSSYENLYSSIFLVTNILLGNIL